MLQITEKNVPTHGNLLSSCSPLPTLHPPLKRCYSVNSLCKRFPKCPTKMYWVSKEVLIMHYSSENHCVNLFFLTNRFNFSIWQLVIIDSFREAREDLKKHRGEDMSYPVLAFHGTKEGNINPIAETGFQCPGTDMYSSVVSLIVMLLQFS